MSLESFLSRTPQRETDPVLLLRTCRVVRSDARGVYVSPINASLDEPIGPCRGGWWRDTSTCASGAHTHPPQRPPVDALVLLASTEDGEWVVTWEALDRSTGG